MTSARAFRELARLQREGWFVAILPAVSGDGEIIVTLSRPSGPEVRGQGATVADVAPELIAQCNRWLPATAGAYGCTLAA